MRNEFAIVMHKRPFLAKMGFKPQVAVTLPSVVRLLADNSTSASGRELFNDNIDAILDEAVTVVASRMKEMIRLVAAAHADIRRAREEGLEFSDAMEGLVYNGVDLPRLPSWIPRNRDAPFDADPEQMLAFLDSHALSTFRCRKCNDVFSGTSAAIHIRQAWNHCVPPHHYDLDKLEADEWLPIGGTEPYGLDTDARTLVRALKLNQLADSMELECSDKTYKDSGDLHGIKMPEEEMYVVRFDRKCDCGFSKGHDLSSTVSLEALFFKSSTVWTKLTALPKQNSYLSKHWATKPGHKVTVTPVVDYSATFRHKVNAAKTRDAYDSLGLGMFDDDPYYGGEDGYSDEDEGMGFWDHFDFLPYL